MRVLAPRVGAWGSIDRFGSVALWFSCAELCPRLGRLSVLERAPNLDATRYSALETIQAITAFGLDRLSISPRANHRRFPICIRGSWTDVRRADRAD